MNEALLSALQKRFPAGADALPVLVAALDAGEPAPFLLRYRRDLLGGLDESTFRKVRAGHREERELLRRRGATRRALEQEGVVDEALLRRVDQTRDLALLEDLIRPAREARRSGSKKAEDPMSAVARALLAATAAEPGEPLEALLEPFCGKEGAHPTVADQTERLTHLLADEIGNDALLRQSVRTLARKKGRLVATPTPGKEVKPQYVPVANLDEALNRVRPRTLLLLRRAQKAGVVAVQVVLPDEALQALRDGALATPDDHPHAALVRAATDEALTRILLPAASVELVNERKRIAERAMIPAFAETLRERLMAPPAGRVGLVAVAPGATGTARLLIVDADGRPGRTEAVHPLPPRGEVAEASRTLLEMVAESGGKIVVVPAAGRSGGLREWVAHALAAAPELGAFAVPVHEGAAAALAESDEGKAAAPDIPASARTALSLGRYVQDPLAEIVRYDLTNLILGANQRDVDQGELRRALEETVEECVALVGPDLNRASIAVLARVPGLDEPTARVIYARREVEGPFETLADLRALEMVSEEAWQRAGGFLRVFGGPEPLDATTTHPTGYDIARTVAARLEVPVADLIGRGDRLRQVDPAEFAGEAHTIDDVTSVLRALARGTADLRGPFVPPVANPGVRRLRDVREGMELDGVVASVAGFGVFVDVGVHQQGLVHVSELCHEFVSSPSEVARVGDRVRVRVLGVEPGKRRMSLSVKALLPVPERPAPPERPAAGQGARGGRREGGPGGPGGFGGPGGPGGRRRQGGGRDRDRDRGRDRGPPRRSGTAPVVREIPRENDPFHMQLSALRAQLGFASTEKSGGKGGGKQAGGKQGGGKQAESGPRKGRQQQAPHTESSPETSPAPDVEPAVLPAADESVGTPVADPTVTAAAEVEAVREIVVAEASAAPEAPQPAEPAEPTEPVEPVEPVAADIEAASADVPEVAHDTAPEVADAQADVPAEALSADDLARPTPPEPAGREPSAEESTSETETAEPADDSRRSNG